MGLMKKLTSGLVTASLVFGLVGYAFADLSDANAVNAAAARMQALKLVQGRGGNDLALGANLTRAEVVTIFVRAFGKADTAALLKSAPSFPDVAGHWASGEIALAKAMAEANGFTLGLPNGTFNPNGNITFAETLALLEKFLGIKPSAGLTWPNDVIDAALNAGIIDAKDKATVAAFPNTAITRGQAFYLADTAFSKVPVDGTKTVYQKFVATTQPSVTVDSNSYTATTTATSATIKGTVANATSLKVNGQDVAIAADGSWSATVALDKVGANTITIEAFDLVGNKATPASPVTITRNPGAAATIQASLSSATVTAGSTATLTVKVLDANGVELKDATYTVTPDATVGTFDATTGTFTAAKVPATGNITITSGSATATIPVTVTAGALAKLDADNANPAVGGKVVLTPKDANGNPISGNLTWSVDDVTNAMVQNGVFTAFKSGNYVVTATAADGTSASTTIGVFGSVAKVVVSAPETVVANGATVNTFTIKVTDANGNLVSNYNNNIKLTTDLLDEDGNTTYAAGATVHATNGVATVKLIAPDTLADSIVPVGAEALNSSGASYSPKITTSVSVTAVAQVATALKVTADPYLDTQNPAGGKVTVSVLDQVGEAMTGGNWAATLTLTGPASFDSSDSTVKSTTVTATGAGTPTTFYPTGLGDLGNITFTASFNGLTTATATSQAVIAKAASKVNVTAVNTEAANADGQSVYKLKVQVVDANGVPVAYTGNVTLTTSLASTISAGTMQYKVDALSSNLDNPAVGYVDLTTNKVTVAFANQTTMYVGFTSNKYVGTFTASATATGLTANATGSVSFKAGAIDGVAMVKSTMNVPATNQSATVSAQLVDVNGNPVKTAGKTVNFSSSSSSVSLSATSAVTDANGVASVTATIAGVPGSTYPVTASYTMPDGSSVSATSNLTVVTQVPTTITAGLYNKGTGKAVSTVSAGTAYELRVTIKDQFGSVMDMTNHGDGSQLTGVKVEAVAGGVEEDLTTLALVDNAAPAAYQAADVTPTTTGTLTLKVTDVSGVTDLVATKSVSVGSDTMYGFKIAESTGYVSSFDNGGTAVPGSLTVTSGKAQAFTVQLVDKYGNLVDPTKVSSDIQVNLTADPGTTGYADIRGTENGVTIDHVTIKGGTNSATFYLITNGDAPTLDVVDNAGALAGLSGMTINVK